jgi:L-alanine-DL-glutamate epimerase-like enolase superfamily enzyme
VGSGGISPAIKVAHLAESFHMDCEIHGTGAGNLAVAAAIPNTTFYERGLLHPMIGYNPPRAYQLGLDDETDQGGFLRPSDEPGLGQRLDRAYISAHQI